MKEILEYRMYFLTMYNLSGIQKGIQCGHAAVEYAMKYGDTHEFKEWFEYYKTFILLNGGTSGTMLEHFELLKKMNVNVVPFYEPDLNMSLSALAFIVDERVFNKEKYPEFKKWVQDTYPDENISNQYNWTEMYYNQWIDYIGGEEIYELREFLKYFKLA